MTHATESACGGGLVDGDGLDWTRWARCCTRGRFGLLSLPTRYYCIALCTYLTCILALNRVAKPPRQQPQHQCAASPLSLLARVIIRTLPTCTAPGCLPLRLMRSACVHSATTTANCSKGQQSRGIIHAAAPRDPRASSAAKDGRNDTLQRPPALSTHRGELEPLC